MPGSNASSDGFDRSPLHAEGGGAAAEEEEQPEVKAEATEQPGADTGDEKMNEEATSAGESSLNTSTQNRMHACVYACS